MRSALSSLIGMALSASDLRPDFRQFGFDPHDVFLHRSDVDLVFGFDREVERALARKPAR